jgi:GxxExxY protein
MILGDSKYRHSALAGAIIGAAQEVHRVLGTGFLESVYEEALAHELRLQGLQVQRQVQVPIFYKEVSVGKHVLDLLVDDKVIVELKAVSEVAEVHTAIVLSYLAATKLEVALLINFGKPSLQCKRIVR